MKNNIIVFCSFLFLCVSCYSQNKIYNSTEWKKDKLGLEKRRIITNEKLFYETFIGASKNKINQKLGKPDYIIKSDGNLLYNYCRESYKYGNSIEDFKNDTDCRGSYISLIIKDKKVIDIVYINAGG